MDAIHRANIDALRVNLAQALLGNDVRHDFLLLLVDSLRERVKRTGTLPSLKGVEGYRSRGSLK
jgi:hypothetical protein